MKYYRKQPVEAMQWNGDNQMEVSEFIQKVTKSFATKDDGFGNLNVCYLCSKKRKHQVAIPKFGWVVVEGKTLQFYKDETFKRTFKSAEEDNKGIDWAGMTNTINSFDDVFNGFYGAYKEKLMADVDEQVNKVQEAVKEAAEMHKDPFFVPANLKVCVDNANKWLDGMTDKCIEGFRNQLNPATFNSVLDEMKRLHENKNAEYGDAAHVNFIKYGPVASISRLSEKMQRAEHILLSGKCEVKDEPLTATLIDMAITSAMLYMELKNQKNVS